MTDGEDQALPTENFRPRILRRIRGLWGSSSQAVSHVGVTGVPVLTVGYAPAAFAAMSVRCWEPSRRMRPTAV
ncbi:hypothetical protein QFZ43_004633 [Streptomyces afghaniensis]|nr:hypothetical protein [Streptomyces afghaniensis]